jgi:hypothetical protein
MDVDARTELIQVLIPLSLWHVKKAPEQEVKILAGERYKRRGMKRCDYWGKQSEAYQEPFSNFN